MADTSKLEPIPFPFGGIDYFDAYSDGSPMGSNNSLPVTQSCQNVRGLDMTVSRRRGCARSGTNKYNPINPPSGISPIQEIAAFLSSRADPSIGTGQLVVNAIDHNTGSTGFSLLDAKLQPYMTDKSLPSTITLYNILWISQVPAGNFYQVGTDSSVNQFFVRKVNSVGTQIWTRHFGTTSGPPYIPLGMCAGPTGLAIAVHSSGVNAYEIWILSYTDGTNEGTEPNLTSTAGTIGTILPSYNAIAYDSSITRWAIAESGGCRIINASTNATVGSLIAPGSATLERNWRVISGPAGTFYYCLGTASGAVYDNYVYAINATATVTATATYACGALGDGADISYNPETSVLVGVFSTTSTATAGLITLNTSTLGATASQNNPFGNTINASSLQTLYGGGVMVFSYAGGVNQNIVQAYYMAAGSPLVPTTIITFWQDNSNYPYLYSSSNFTAAPANPTAFYNSYTYLAVSGGVVFEFTSEINYEVGNVGQLSSTAPVIFSAQQGDYLYFADGVSTLRYNSITDQIESWTASAGSLPIDNDSNYPRLICLWRNRIVQAGLLDDASNWFMSAVGDATNWNYSPAGGPFQTQAVAGNNSVAGEVGDVINTLIPFSDDLLIFGGNHSIWQMTGDPMAGGQIDLISDITGMPFGKPWCVDPANNIYFVGSRGGVFIMPASNSGAGQPTRISTKTIDAALEYLDYTQIIVRMAWDDLEQGLHLFLTPISNPSGVISYWYDARNQSWWPDLLTNASYNPLAICVLAGTKPADRVILMGGTDGYIRKFDPAATTDDGLPLISNVLLGPYYNVYLNELQVTLSSASSAVTVKIQPGKDAFSALVGAATWTGTFSSTGRNRSQNPMIYGNVMYINVTGTGFYAIEQIIACMKPGTQARQRIF